MTTKRTWVVALGNDKETYRIAPDALRAARASAEAAVDQSTALRGVPCWDEFSAEAYCQMIGRAVQEQGVRA